jgi:hypothetical protein
MTSGFSNQDAFPRNVSPPKWGTPPPPGILESTGYARYPVKILHFKELRGKIFRIKDLAPG